MLMLINLKNNIYIMHHIQLVTTGIPNICLVQTSIHCQLYPQQALHWQKAKGKGEHLL